MSTRYLRLVLAVLAGIAAVVLLARRPAAPRAPVIPQAPHVVTMRLAIEHGRTVPEAEAVPKDVLVRLSLVNLDAQAHTLRLAGYEDRVTLTVAAHDSALVEFAADRPGEAFAWLLDGEPAGRLVVSGSHLEEGHR